MNHFYKGKAISLLALTAFVVMVFTTFAQPVQDNARSPKLFSDTIPVRSDTLPLKTSKDSLRLHSDTLKSDVNSETVPVIIMSEKPVVVDTSITNVSDTFDFKSSTDSLDAPVSYHADDSMVFDVPSKKLMLFGKTSTVKYTTSELGAPYIEYDQATNLIKAVLVKDSTGKVVAYPTYIDKEFKSISDTLEVNMKTGKGLTKGTYTQQGEMFVYGERIKKAEGEVFYALRGRFTTCNLDTPHFAFVSSKIKFINKKMAFSGPVHPEFEGVPLPIVLPFGIYPLTQGRRSGLLAPSFTANDQYGLAVEGLGYYKILGPSWDAIARGTLYSYGGWALGVNPRYFKKYRYQGNLSLNTQRTKIGFRGDPDFSVRQTTFLQWAHNADTKARPGVTFTGSVNAGSSRYNENVPNSPQRNFTNQLTSTISYAKVWKNKPYNISIAASHNQNTVQRLININFPDVNFNVNTIYPFRRAEPIGPYKWYENLGVALNTTARSTSSFIDTLSGTWRQLSDNYRWGASHNVPISLSLPPLGPVQVAPTVTYQERWFQQREIVVWDRNNKQLDTIVRRGFYTARDMSFAVNLSTRIFGSYTFRKNSKVRAIRHEIRPSVAASLRPDFNSQNYYDVQLDSSGKNFFNRSYYDGAIFQGFSGQRFAGLNFVIDNNIQMKVRNRKDTTEGSEKKVTLIDGLSLAGSYNFLADSFNLSQLNMSARTNLFEKVSITANATFDPYQTNSAGQRIDRLIWNDKILSLGTLNGAGVSMSSQFKGGDKTVGPGNLPINNINVQQNVSSTGLPLDEYQQEAMYMNNNPGEFADFSIPWSVDVSYSLRYSQSRTLVKGVFQKVKSFNQDVNFNNSVNLTPKWKIGIQGSYNITQKELGVLSMYLSRELHCWQMTLNIAPVGRFRFFTINISPRSTLLRDLKVNRTRYFYDQ